MEGEKGGKEGRLLPYPVVKVGAYDGFATLHRGDKQQVGGHQHTTCLPTFTLPVQEAKRSEYSRTHSFIARDVDSRRHK